MNNVPNPILSFRVKTFRANKIASGRKGHLPKVGTGAPKPFVGMTRPGGGKALQGIGRIKQDANSDHARERDATGLDIASPIEVTPTEEGVFTAVSGGAIPVARAKLRTDGKLKIGVARSLAKVRKGV